MTALFSTHALPSTMPTTVNSPVSIWIGSPTFFFNISAAVLPRTTALFRVIAGHAAGDDLEVIPGKPAPFAGGDHHHLRALHAGDVDEARADGGDVRQMRDALERRRHRMASA